MDSVLAVLSDLPCSIPKYHELCEFLKIGWGGCKTVSFDVGKGLQVTIKRDRLHLPESAVLKTFPTVVKETKGSKKCIVINHGGWATQLIIQSTVASFGPVVCLDVSNTPTITLTLYPSDFVIIAMRLDRANNLYYMPVMLNVRNAHKQLKLDKPFGSRMHCLAWNRIQSACTYGGLSDYVALVSSDSQAVFDQLHQMLNHLGLETLPIPEALENVQTALFRLACRDTHVMKTELGAALPDTVPKCVVDLVTQYVVGSGPPRDDNIAYRADVGIKRGYKKAGLTLPKQAMAKTALATCKRLMASAPKDPCLVVWTAWSMMYQGIVPRAPRPAVFNTDCRFKWTVTMSPTTRDCDRVFLKAVRVNSTMIRLESAFPLVVRHAGGAGKLQHGEHVLEVGTRVTFLVVPSGEGDIPLVFHDQEVHDAMTLVPSRDLQTVLGKYMVHRYTNDDASINQYESELFIKMVRPFASEGVVCELAPPGEQLRRWLEFVDGLLSEKPQFLSQAPFPKKARI